MEAREHKKQVAVLCCDLSKAFDVADHTVLAVKLRHYGIAGAPLELLTDIMRNRSQIVVGGGGLEKSDPLTSKMGVAQGSSVSNIMFSLLLNDLPEAIDVAEIMMYADDVAAVVTAPSLDILEQRLNDTAADLARWFRRNGLVLNLKKTHFLHFTLSGRPSRTLGVLVDGHRIEQTDTTAFLGFELDRSLTWEAHIHKVCGKVGSASFALWRLSRIVPAEVVRSCYFATVHSHLQYGAELWGRAADWERAFRMQKRAVRAIVRVPQDVSARPYFKSLGILTLPSLVIYQVAVYVRTNLDSFRKLGDAHKYNIRNATKLVAQTRSLTKSDKLTHVMGPTVYNRLPDSVTSAPSLESFKSRLRRWLVKHSFYCYNELVECKN